MAVRSTVKKRSQDEHVQRALKKSVPFRHRRLSTLTLRAIVDIRPLTVKRYENPVRI
jgi:hypothetical protein